MCHGGRAAKCQIIFPGLLPILPSQLAALFRCNHRRLHSSPSMSSISKSLRALSLTARQARPISTTAPRPETAQPDAAAVGEPSSSTDLVASTALTMRKWSQNTQRTGVLARKQGMTCLWDADGIRVPVTVLHVRLRNCRPRMSLTHLCEQLDEVQVLSSNTYSSPSTSALPPRHSVVLGCSPRRAKTASAAMLGQFEKAGVEPKMRIVEFPVSEDAVVPAGEWGGVLGGSACLIPMRSQGQVSRRRTLCQDSMLMSRRHRKYYKRLQLEYRGAEQCLLRALGSGKDSRVS